ncbi:MAG: hypothetical protein A3J38_02810 [Gammaproteobacteria bacterium RIFCSPHIGHO2_12_FULL_45_9]|nr:MAG: hypothetical protein A3J38_02810 [Gammaproteobacteria bacterium RIFCSPHIGHO2_12_FULL_45_9]
MSERALSFYLRRSESPTYCNLWEYLQAEGWQRARSRFSASFGEQNFQFDERAAECLEFKHLLAELVEIYCPTVMPVTFCINEQNWPYVLSQIRDRFYIQEEGMLDQVENLVWILKPSMLNNGQHIKIFERVSQLEAYYLNPNRLGGEHVLQQYILHPHLLKGPSLGHKYSIRMFVVLTNYAGVYVYPRGYFNIALRSYRSDKFTDPSVHLTNEHLKEDTINVVQIPTEQYALFEPYYPQIKAIISEVIKGLTREYPLAFRCEKNRLVALFGFDFIVDATERIWLLEANHAPCFPTHDSHPLRKSLYDDFWRAFIASFAQPIASATPPEDIQYQLFERV